ncbi:hypothetical protein Vafri_1885 [Volvox africanus]|nr:hypothetical protein Vafri_1885 [Volvox africanus]
MMSTMRVISEGATSYWAPEGDCLAALSSSSGSSTSTGNSGGNSTTLRVKVSGGGFQDSCFATQVVVYIYNPCVDGSSRKAASAAFDPGMAASNGSSGGGSNSSRAQRVLALLEETLEAQAGEEQLVNHALGYVDVLVTYSSYDKCIREGVDRLYDVSVQVMIFSALLFGWLVVLLLLPSLYRLFLEFPFRMLLHSIRTLQGKDNALKPMRPGLHSHKHRSVNLPRVMAKVVAPLLLFRKHLLYAVITVHYSNGQSRWLQVSVISTVALSIAQAVYSPGILPPLEHLVPPIALQITRDGTAMAALRYFFDIVVFSSFMGTLGYLSMLANYNSPVNRYYRLQVILSAFFMALQDFLVLLQLVSLLSQWRYLNPRWPYLPLVVFQLVNLAAANLMQVVIFTRRHDQHNRAVYNAYMAAKNARGEAAAAVEARTTGSGGGGRRRRTGDSSGGAGSNSGSSSSAAEENIVIAEILDGDGSAWRQRRSRQETNNASGGGGGGDDYYVNVRRHRERSAPQLEMKQQRRRRRKQHDCVEEAEGEIEGEEEEAEEEAEHEQRRRQRAQATQSSGQQNTRRLTWRAEDINDDENDGDYGGGREEVRGRRGNAGQRAVVVTAAVASDASKTDTEPPSDHGSSRRRSSRRPRRATDDAEDKSIQRGRNADAHAPAAASSATTRPRRRLLGDASLGPGPVAEGVENLEEEAAIAGGSGGAAASRLLMRRRGSRNGVAFAAERPASSSDWSQGGGSSRRLLVPTPERNVTTAAAAAAGGADSSSGGGERERNRRLYGGSATAGLDEQNGVPYYKRPYNFNKIAAAAELAPAERPDTGGVGAKGSAPKATAAMMMTPAAAPTPMATVGVIGSGGGGGGGGDSQSAPLPGPTKPPLLSQMRSARAAGSWNRIGSHGSVLREEDLHARIRDVAAAAGTPYNHDSDVLDSDRGGGGGSSSSSNSSSDAEGDQGRKKHTHGAMRGVLVAALRPLRRLWRGLRESPDFRYPSWLLAALLVSAYMVIFHYGKALSWSSHLDDCLQDPTNCMASVMGRYLKFVVRLLSVANQQQLRDVLVSILARKNDLMEAFAGMMGITNEPNGTITATQLLVLDKETLLEQATSNADLEAALTNLSATLNQSLSGLAPNEEVAAMVSKITANLSTIVLSNLNSTVGRLVDATNNKLASAVPVQEAIYRRLNSTVNVLYDMVNTTTRFLTKALDVEGEIRIWRSNLSSRLRWTSAFGFTLGLLLGLSTLLQTAVSFRRAIRRACRMRVARRLLKSLFVSGGAAGTDAAAAAPGAGASLAGKDVLLKGGEESLLVTRARDAKISVVVFFFGVLMSTAVIQLYMVGVLLSVILAVLAHPWTWHYLMPKIWLYIVAIAAVFVLNKYILIGYVGNAFLSDGDHIYRPAAWLAFIVIMSITNLVIGLLLAVYRIVLLVLTSVLALGKLEVTIFTFFSWLDLAHASFLAGLHMHESMSNFHDPIYLPGPRGRAHRRWRKLREIVRRLTPEELRLLATLGRPKEVQDCLDHVVVDMKAARKLAAANRSVDAASSSLTAGAPGLSRFAGVGSGPSSVQHTSTSGKLQPSPVVESWGRCSREDHGAGATATATAAVGAGASGIRRHGSEHPSYSTAAYGRRRGDGSSKGMRASSGELNRGRVYARLVLGDEDTESEEEGNEEEREAMEEEEAHVDLARRRRGGSSSRGKKAQV